MPIVLIVDDDIQTTRLLSSLIEKAGYEAVAVNDSMKAAQTAKDIKPDLVLMDIMMPHINGIELCRLFKADPDLKGIPVFMVSALGDTGTMKDSQNAGAQDFIKKPFQAKDLQKKIKDLLG
jgi:two-component system phosphate regulon response regulator PhoB